jgi:diguanylate cyclase (GGDEF)-like protein
VILLTGQEQVGSKVRALDAGATDYLVKPFHEAELVARLRVHLKVKQLQDALREKNHELEELSRRDPLTSVYNRRAFHESLELEFARHARYARPFSFMMVDLDHFKRVNDTHGHQAGDLALTTAANVLVATLRTNDVVGRYGGEEFAVLLPETPPAAALLVAERCRATIANTPLVHGETVFSVTASIGLASMPDPRVSSTEELIRLADEALYAAKDHGRNRLIAA